MKSGLKGASATERIFAMRNRMFIIGNGFDLAHALPTRFDPDFKEFAEAYEQWDFWGRYQTEQENIWSDFENLLAHPDINTLEEIFNGYAPNYLSDRESDRDAIIYQVELNGRLNDALTAFANNAEQVMKERVNKISYLENIIDSEACYLNFNYTHTLKHVYGISAKQVLHIHGEVGMNNLALGYPEGSFKPEPYLYDVRQKGRGPYAEMDPKEYIEKIDDYYTRTAYTNLLDKCKSFSKEIRIDLLAEFLNERQSEIEEFIVYGHSCGIDFDYFHYLICRYSKAMWKFFVRGEEQKTNVIKNIVDGFAITKFEIIEI